MNLDVDNDLINIHAYCVGDLSFSICHYGLFLSSCFQFHSDRIFIVLYMVKSSFDAQIIILNFYKHIFNQNTVSRQKRKHIYFTMKLFDFFACGASIIAIVSLAVGNQLENDFE